MRDGRFPDLGMGQKAKSRSLVGHLPATSWPLPQARLAVDLGGPDYGLARDDKFRTQAGAAKMAALRKATSKTEVGASSDVFRPLRGLFPRLDSPSTWAAPIMAPLGMTMEG